MVECAIALSNGNVSTETISEILTLGKDMIAKPVELLDGVREVLQYLGEKYRLFLLTKGDLLDQERKLQRSGLSVYFHHIEVLSDKKENNYKELLEHLEVDVAEFLMIGNSLKSDVLPIINIGAQAIHVPFHTTWTHETVHEDDTNGKHYKTVASVKEILNYL